MQHPGADGGGRPEPTGQTLAAGTRVGRYRVLYLLSRGGLAEVYVVQHVVLGTLHALKVLTRSHAGTSLIPEGRVQAQVLSPHVLPVLDVLDAHGSDALLMPWIRGGSLRSLMDQVALTEEEAVALFAGILDGISAVHAAGIVHRDLKPANVLLDLGVAGVQPRVADFGLAGRSSSGSDTRHWGTPGYAAPEQRDGSVVDHRADLWALGVIGHELWLGHRPHGVAVDPSLPESVAPILRRLLHPDPDQRWANAGEVRRALGPVDRSCLAWEHRLATHLQSGIVATDGFQATLHTGSLPRADRGQRSRDAFVGRAEELRVVHEALQASRVVTITGFGGVGKTRLCQQFLQQRGSAWPGGVWFVDLASTHDAASVMHGVARVLDVPVATRHPDEQIGNVIRGLGPCVVVLDNVEQVRTEALELLPVWLRRAPDATFLLTSRVRVGLAEERVVPLDGLGPDEACALFVERARAADPAFRVAAEEEPLLQEVLTLLDALPLGIELAAARVTVLSIEGLRAQLDDRFALLRAVSGPRPSRHASLRDTLDWSWALLEPHEQRGLSQLSVFAGAFDLDAADAVLDVGVPTLDLLQRLVEQSMVRVPAPGRFALLVTVRDYATEQLSEHHDGADAERRHGAYFAELGQGLCPRLAGPDLGVVLDILTGWLPDLEIGCRRAAARGDGGMATTLLQSVWSVVETRGPASIAFELAERVEALLDVESDGPVAGGEPSARVRFDDLRSTMLYRTGRISDGRALLEGLAAWAERVGDAPRHREYMARLALTEHEAGALDASLAHYEQALAVARDAGDRALEARILSHLGTLLREVGRNVEALAALQRGLALHRDLGASRFEAATSGNLGNLHMDQGRWAQANEYFQEALALQRRLGDRRAQAFVLGNLGLLAQRQGDYDAAQQAMEASVALHREIGNRMAEGRLLGNLGSLHADRGQLDMAMARYRASKAIQAEVGDRRLDAVLSGWIAAVQLQRGQLEEARHGLERALAIDASLPMHRYAASWLRDLGTVCARESKIDQAIAHWQGAEARCQATQDRFLLCGLYATWAVELAPHDAAGARVPLRAALELADALPSDPNSALRALLRRARAAVGPEGTGGSSL